MRFLTLELRNTEIEPPSHSEEHMFCGWNGELPLIPVFLTEKWETAHFSTEPVSCQHVSQSVSLPVSKKSRSRIYKLIFLHQMSPRVQAALISSFLIFYISVKYRRDMGGEAMSCHSKSAHSPAGQASPASALGIQNLRPDPYPQNQKLHFNVITKWLIVKLKFEKHWLIYPWNKYI